MHIIFKKIYKLYSNIKIMPTIEEMERFSERRKEAEKRNPLLKLNLGELVSEMIKLYVSDNNVVKPADQVPAASLENYWKYQSIINELKSREESFNSYKESPICGTLK